MKDNRFLFFAAVALALASCTAIGVRKVGVSPESPPKESAAAGSGTSAPVQKPAKELPAEGPEQEDDGLDQSNFANLPKEAKAYFSRLSIAFRAGDKQFLASQGETDYSARNRPNMGEEEYLALLYRIGPYARESPKDSDRIPRLKLSEIKSVRYQGWEEQGPVIEMRGTLVIKGSGPAPFRIMLLWRLEEPKILGREP